MSVYGDVLKTMYVYVLHYVFVYEFENDAYRCVTVQKYTEHGGWERAWPKGNNRYQGEGRIFWEDWSMILK